MYHPAATTSSKMLAAVRRQAAAAGFIPTQFEFGDSQVASTLVWHSYTIYCMQARLYTTYSYHLPIPVSTFHLFTRGYATRLLPIFCQQQKILLGIINYQLTR